MATTGLPLHLAGADALDALTQLAQRCRLERPLAAGLEAADLHWWARLDEREEPWRCAVWTDDAGPSAAVFATRMARADTIDVMRSSSAPSLDELRPHVAAALAQMDRERTVDAWAADDDREMIGLWQSLGLADTGDAMFECWLDVADRRPAGELPAGFSLRNRTQLRGQHHLARRNGPKVEERLLTTSLYRPELDLAIVRDSDDTVAAYALFWADPVTGVGLVEPVRTEDECSGQGFASLLVRTGVDLLAAAGCTRCKVLHEADNEAARRAYAGAGFVQVVRDLTFARDATPPPDSV